MIITLDTTKLHFFKLEETKSGNWYFLHMYDSNKELYDVEMLEPKTIQELMDKIENPIDINNIEAGVVIPLKNNTKWN